MEIRITTEKIETVQYKTRGEKEFIKKVINYINGRNKS